MVGLCYVKKGEEIGLDLGFLNHRDLPISYHGYISMFLVHAEPQLRKNMIKSKGKQSNI